MAIPTHVKWLKEGRDSWNKRREARHFIPSLKKAVLTGMDLSEYNLRGAVLTEARMAGVNLTNANLMGADLTSAILTDANLTGVKANATTFRRTNLQRATLRDGYLTNAVLDGANLTGVDLRNSMHHSASWLGARLRDAIITSTDVGYPKQADFVLAKGLTQQQISTAKGDTGVMLPHGLVHPEEWAHWEDTEAQEAQKAQDIKSSDIPFASAKFVFLSYSNKDSEIASKISAALASANISVWWDKDIPSGANWRNAINEKLDQATVVLTIWTENSTKSSPVIEEAGRAQRGGKLLPVKMDTSALPYGFSETQYLNFQSWKGDANDPIVRTLVQTILDRFNPLTQDAKESRLVASAPVAAIIENGLVSAKDTPLDARPPVEDKNDLSARLKAQEVLTQKILDAISVLDNNLGESVRFDLLHLLKQLQSTSLTWYTLSDSISDVASHLQNEDISWPGTTENSIKRLLAAHEELRPLMQPAQPVPTLHSSPLPPPSVSVQQLEEEALKEVADLAHETFNSDEANAVFADPTISTGEYFAVEIDHARTSTSPNPEHENRRLGKLQKALVGLAGLVGTAITTISYGISVNLLTAPDAAAILLKTMKKLLELIMSFF